MRNSASPTTTRGDEHREQVRVAADPGRDERLGPLRSAVPLAAVVVEAVRLASHAGRSGPAAAYERSSAVVGSIGPAAAGELQQDPGERDRQEPDVQPEEEHAGRDRRLVRRRRRSRQAGDVQQLRDAGAAGRDRDDRDDARRARTPRGRRPASATSAGTPRHAKGHDERDPPRDLGARWSRSARPGRAAGRPRRAVAEAVDRAVDVGLLGPAAGAQEQPRPSGRSSGRPSPPPDPSGRRDSSTVGRRRRSRR